MVGSLQMSDFITQMLRPRLTLTTSYDRFITAKKIIEFMPTAAKADYILPDGRVLGSVDVE